MASDLERSSISSALFLVLFLLFLVLAPNIGGGDLLLNVLSVTAVVASVLTVVSSVDVGVAAGGDGTV